jgi:putative transposase
MTELGLFGLPTRRHRDKTNLGHRASTEDLVNRVFDRDGPNQLWMTDITEHPTREGKLHCCSVLDAFSCRVVGWWFYRRPTVAMVNAALGMAIGARRPATGSVVHSDPLNLVNTRRFATPNDWRRSAPHSRSGASATATTNAMTESTIGLYKTELINPNGPWRTTEMVELASLPYLDWFNIARLHTEISDVPPTEFEATHYRQQLPTEMVA